MMVELPPQLAALPKAVLPPAALHRDDRVIHKPRASVPPTEGEPASNDVADGAAAPNGCSTSVTTQRIKEILGGFEFFQAMGAGLQSKLALVTSSAVYPAGSVLFREGDPPGNCYVILSGKVGIYIAADEDEDEDDANRVPTPVQDGGGRRRSISADPLGRRNSRIDSATLRRESAALRFETEDGGSPKAAATQGTPTETPKGAAAKGGLRRSLSRMGSGPLDKIIDVQPTVTRTQTTVEGFSTYSTRSNFGTCVKQMGKGELLGELALLHNSKRSATARCLDETEFLVIGRQEFDQIFKQELKNANESKISFLQEHVPGMKEVRRPRGKPHAAYNFRQGTFLKGYTFMKQGMPTKDCVYVVTKGTVQVGVRENAAPNAQMLKLCTLLPGGFFGLLPNIMNVTAPAPFTIVAISGSVEVFYANSEDVCRMPRRLVNNMREYLAQTTLWHLQKLEKSRHAKQEAADAAGAVRRSALMIPKPGTPGNSLSPNGRRMHIHHSLPQLCPNGHGDSYVSERSRLKTRLGSESRLPSVSGRLGSKESTRSSRSSMTRWAWE